jgi:hypothetical protein
MIIFLIFLFSSYFQPHKIFAISPTIAPTDAQNEIQKIREVVQQKVKEKLKEISQPSNTPKGIIGNIIQVDANQFTIEYQNNSRIVKFDDTTVFIDSNRNKSKADKFKIGQDILAMGTFDDSNILIAKRIISIDLKSIVNDQRVVVTGKIVDVSKSSSIFALIPIKNKNIQYQIKTDTKTGVTNSTDQKITVNDLQSGQKIITILTPDQKLAKTYYAQKIINLDYQPPVTPTLKPTPTKKP